MPLLKIEQTGPQAFRLAGELDLSTVPSLQFLETDEVGGDLVLDFTELRFIDGSGLEWLSRVAAGVSGSVIVQNPRQIIQRMIAKMAIRNQLPNLVLSTTDTFVPTAYAAAAFNFREVLVTESSPESLCRELVAAALGDLGPGHFAGVGIWQDCDRQVSVFSDCIAEELEAVQVRSDEGPTLQAVRSMSIVSSSTLVDERRWPEFTNFALHEGVASAVVLPLAPAQQPLGALSLYSQREHAFSDDRISSIAKTARSASFAIANSVSYWNAKEVIRQLQEALDSRAVIDQAKGVLMAGEGISAEEAFRTLRKASQRSNLKVRELSRRIVDEAVQRAAEGRPSVSIGF